jgi:hypothetical protein
MGVKVLSHQESIDLKLGPLDELRGHWVAKEGWNVIAVPGPKNTQGFTLEVIPFRETISFTPVVVAGNRGPFVDGVQQEQHLTGLMYEQIVTSTCPTELCHKMGFGNGTEIHAERGILLNVTDFNTAPAGIDGATAALNIARLATVPHGNSILALGHSIDGVPPNNDFFGSALIKPRPVNPAERLPLGYEETQYNHRQFPNFNQTDPNIFLREKLGDGKLISMTTLVMSTKNGTGGILNIPFIDQHIKTTDMQATFWIERIKNSVPNESDILQLQYTQTINLVFPATGSSQMIIWPHVTVSTLRKER